MKKLLILGAGGSGMDIITIIRDINKVNPEWEIIGFLDDNPKLLDKIVCNYKVLGTIDDGYKFPEAYFCSSIAHPNNRIIRRKVYQRVKQYSNKFATLIHPSTIIYNGASFAEGVVVNAGCIFGTNVKIMANVHFGYGCSIAHESVIESHVAFGSGVKVSSGVVIGSDSYIGAGVSTAHDVLISSDTLVAAGSAIVTNTSQGDTWIGVPGIQLKNYVKKQLQIEKIIKEQKHGK
ncbi:MAG: hypothetical protein RR555_05595 [Bacteroidales bacterium]